MRAIEWCASKHRQLGVRGPTHASFFALLVVACLAMRIMAVKSLMLLQNQTGVLPAFAMKAATRTRDRDELLMSLRAMNLTTVKSTYRPGKPHDLAVILKRRKWETSTGTNIPRYLVYIQIPKAGSTTMKRAFQSDPLKLNCSKNVHLDDVDLRYNDTESQYENPVIFSLIRDPGQRIASAYSTLVHRYWSNQSNTMIFGKTNKEKLESSPTPTGNDTATWIKHFKHTIHSMMNVVHENAGGWHHKYSLWNEHIVPQIEFLRGYNLSFIGCIESIEDTFAKIQLNVSSEKRKDNSYEHSHDMPAEKFQSFDLLDLETKALVRKVYREDYELYRTFCT